MWLWFQFVFVTVDTIVFSQVSVVSSYILREGNDCAHKLANDGHAVQGAWWSNSLPEFIYDKCEVLDMNRGLLAESRVFSLHLFWCTCK
jgi:hypothetical protein